MKSIMKMASFRFWTWVAALSSIDKNSYASIASYSFYKVPYEDEFDMMVWEENHLQI